MIITFYGESFETIADYYQSIHWKTLKKRYFQVPKNNKCALCHATEDLHLTHKYMKNLYRVKIRNDKGKLVLGPPQYCSILGRESFKDLRTLCASCQELVYEYQLVTLVNKGKIQSKDQLLKQVKKRGIKAKPSIRYSPKDRCKECVDNPSESDINSAISEQKKIKLNKPSRVFEKNKVCLLMESLWNAGFIAMSVKKINEGNKNDFETLQKKYEKQLKKQLRKAKRPIVAITKCSHYTYRIELNINIQEPQNSEEASRQNSLLMLKDILRSNGFNFRCIGELDRNICFVSSEEIDNFS
jgi:hypothetical protein